MRTLVLRAMDVGAIVDRIGLDALMDRMIEQLSTACREHQADRYFIPVRSGCPYEHPNPGLIEWMPAVRYGQRSLMKTVGYHPSNAWRSNLPTILSTLQMHDTQTGRLLAVMDGTFITALRTGAASALASRVLARPGSATIGLIGCGAQAVTQLHALSRTFPIERVLVHDIDGQAINSFARRASFLECASILAASAEQIRQEADIICTATTVEAGRGPVISDGDHHPWLHVNAIGSDFPGKIELPRSFLDRALVCPDFVDQAVLEGECQQLAPSQIGPDLVELLKREAEYTAARERLTVFDSTGWALEDYVGCQMLVDLARQLNVGESVRIECTGDDPRDPYTFACDKRQAAVTASLPGSEG